MYGTPWYTIWCMMYGILYPMVKIHGTVPNKAGEYKAYIKPIQGICAIYFYTGVYIYLYTILYLEPKWGPLFCLEFSLQK